MPTIKELILTRDYAGLEKSLSENPALANEGIPYDEINTSEAHPLHRICDGVFSGQYTDDEAVEMAKIFLANGAAVNGRDLIPNKDSPLVAAASLHADKVGMLYVDSGANIQHAGCHGGTALHWAAWCGRPELVERLIKAGSEINRLCTDFKATPLFWAVHGLKNGGNKDSKKYLEVVDLLLSAGADKAITNGDGSSVFDLLQEEDREIRALLEKQV
ncbi:ankyrin repeat domain-containing protein [Flavihumibacter sediminis]|nr:ankyrin repeat domain-containing protein [Flavihumibacter sediminis]